MPDRDPTPLLYILEVLSKHTYLQKRVRHEKIYGAKSMATDQRCCFAADLVNFS